MEILALIVLLGAGITMTVGAVVLAEWILRQVH